MKKSKWGVALATIAVGAVIVGASQGTQTDPLVSRSYIDQVVLPGILSQVDGLMDEREEDLVAELEDVVRQQVEDLQDELVDGDWEAPEHAANFEMTTLSAGHTLTAAAGCEIVVRGEGVTLASTAPSSLLDLTDGTTLSNGAPLVVNHLYLVVGDGTAIATAGEVSLLVRGDFSVESSG